MISLDIKSIHIDKADRGYNLTITYFCKDGVDEFEISYPAINIPMMSIKEIEKVLEANHD